jgi:peptide/nickel transport system permease protein
LTIFLERSSQSRGSILAGFLARRLALGAATLVGVSMLIFGSTQLLPGDVAVAVLGQQASPEALAAIRASLHLNDPLPVRYITWLWGVLHGDLGRSLVNNRPVMDIVGFRLVNTMALAGLVAGVAVPLAVTLGTLAAIYRDSWLDRAINIFTLSALSLPEFFLGFVLIIVFAVEFPLFPSLSNVSPGMPIGDRLYAMTLPAATLTLVILAHIMRMTRTAIVDVMGRPFIEMTVLKGLPRWRTVLEHALPNALSPIITVITFNLAYLVVGVVVVEVVFVYPGLGQLMVDAVSTRDIPIVQTCGLIFATVYVVLNLVADIAAILTNPRLRGRG